MQKTKKYFWVVPFIMGLFLISCQREVFVESSSDVEDLCSVYVNSNPTGAQIYVDGKYSGYSTPDTLHWLSDSSHTITLKIDMVQDTSITLNLSSNTIANLYVDYFASASNYGSIKCESVPTGAAIYLKHVNVSKVTPNTLTYLFAGTYNVKYHYAGYRDDSSNVTVYGGSSSSLKLSLQDTSVWIDYRISNSDIPSNKIYAVKNDKNNAIWIGTLDNGIVKFSKNIFTHYTSSNSGLVYDFTNCLEVDADNNLWIGTISGLSKFDGTNWTSYTKSTSKLPANYITSIHCDKSGNVWVGTQSGLVRFTNGEMTVLSSQTSSLLQNYVSGITSDANGAVWISSVGGISRLLNGEWTIYTKNNDGLLSYDGAAIAGDLSGNVYCAFLENIQAGITGGLMKFNGSSWSSVSVSSIPVGKIQKAFVDSKGILWLGSLAGLLSITPAGVQTFFNGTSCAMHVSVVKDITEDKSNNIWFALHGGGIVKYKR